MNVDGAAGTAVIAGTVAWPDLQGHRPPPDRPSYGLLRLPSRHMAGTGSGYGKNARTDRHQAGGNRWKSFHNLSAPGRRPYTTVRSCTAYPPADTLLCVI